MFWPLVCLWSKSHYLSVVCQIMIWRTKIVVNQYVMSVWWTIESIWNRKTEGSESPLQLFATLLAHLEAKQEQTDRQTDKKDHTEDRLSNYCILASESPTVIAFIHTIYTIYIYMYLYHLHDIHVYFTWYGTIKRIKRIHDFRSKVIYLLPSLPHLW